VALLGEGVTEVSQRALRESASEGWSVVYSE